MVIKSTVPVGTAQQVASVVAKNFAQRGVDFEVQVVQSRIYEEGLTVNDCRRADRILIGTENEKARDLMRELYRLIAIMSDDFYGHTQC